MVVMMTIMVVMTKNIFVMQTQNDHIADFEKLKMMRI